MKTIEQTIRQVLDASIKGDPMDAEKAIMEYANQNDNIIHLEQERMEWSLKTFPEATAMSSIQHLKREIREVEEHLEVFGLHNEEELTEEYTDCLKCLFDSAGRAGISPEQIFKAFAIKLAKNKARTWTKNADNSYSHVKS